MVEILPSILAADFARLDDEIRGMENAGVKMLHLDVMDGHFVPNISIGPPVVQSVRAATKLHLDVHLMIEDPDRYIGDFADSGANSISVHQEACRHLHRTLRSIQERSLLAGVVINPATPVSFITEVLDIVDYVLVMSVNPGFGGQQFIPRTLAKVMDLDLRRKQQGLDFVIQIDGGITLTNVAETVRAGCEWIVAGSSIFGAPDPAEAVTQMREICREATSIRV